MTLMGNLFEGVAPETLDAWNSAQRPKSFAPGDQLFQIDETPRVVYQICSGRMKVWRPSRSGHALTLFFGGQDYLPGLIPVCRHGRTMAFATAITPMKTFAIPATTVLALLDKDRKFAANAFAIVANMLYRLADRLDDLSSARIEQKVSRALLRLSYDQGWDGHEARIDIGRQDLADLTGTTHYTVSRLMSEWDRQGIVESGRGYVTIKDDEAVAALADMQD